MMTEKGVAVLAASLAMLSSLLPLSMGAGLVGAVFTGDWTEGLVDSDHDGLFEEMDLTVEVRVFESGSYGIYGSIGGGVVHGSSGLVVLPSGESEIVVPFSGADIITMRPEGRFAIDLELYSSDPGTPVKRFEVTTTASYDPDDFERGPDYPGTSVTVAGDSVMILNPMVEIRVNSTRPLLQFSYPGADGTNAALECVRMVAYGDLDADGLYGTDDEVLYSADLSNDVDWKMNLDLTSGYRIDLRGIVPLRMTGAPEVAAWASVTITLDSSAIRPPGNSQKFDISIELLQGMDADGIAVVQELRDESGGHLFAYHESGLPSSPDRTISLTDADGRVNGIYSWNDAILMGSGRADTPSRCGSAYRLMMDRAEVVFSYELGNGTLFVYHDPTVGIDPGFRIEGGTHRDFMSNRPLGMAIGLVLGLALVLGAVAAARNRRG